MSEFMAVVYFQDDEDGYSAWLAKHSNHGHVVNLDLHSTDGTRIHRASCHTLKKGAGGGELLTHSFPKACSLERSELDDWHRAEFGVGLRKLRCKHCEPSSLGLT